MNASLTVAPLVVTVALPAVEPALKDRESATCPADCAASVGKGSHCPRWLSSLKYYDAECVGKGSHCLRSSCHKNRTSALLVTVALPAVEVAPNFKAALLVKLALPAVALSPKVMSPVLVKSVKLPAVALFRKFITVGPETKFWVIPELFVMPTPLMVNEKKGLCDRERARARVEHDAVDLCSWPR